MEFESVYNSKLTPGLHRLAALDALRGFTMFWIIGGERLFESISELTGWHWLGRQMRHVSWNGFSFMDLIFPLFMFAVGVSTYISTSRGIEKGKSKKELYYKAFRRMLILMLLGLIYKNAPLSFDVSKTRFVSVLGRIGITGFVVVLITLNNRVRGQIAWLFGILVAYWAAMKLIPVPGYGAGVLTLEGNLAGYIDRAVLPGRLIQGVFDENGLLTTVPCICIVLMGALAGKLLFSDQYPKHRKVVYLALAGIACLLLGGVWGLSFPINKHLWSSSFVMLTCGLSLLLLSLFYLIIDVWGYKKWSFPFMVIGLNSVTIYMACRLIDFSHTATLLLDGIIRSSSESTGTLILALGTLTLEWLFLYFLYRKNIFLKV